MNSIKLFDVLFDYGQDHSGVRQGPTHLRENGLLQDLNAIAPVEEVGTLDLWPKERIKLVDGIKNKRPCAQANADISSMIESQDLSSSFLLNVGGDHGMGLGTVHGMLAQDPDTVVVWADAHGDINTPDSSPSGNFHGMPVAFLLGLIKDPDFGWIRQRLMPKDLVFFGPRDLDDGEKKLIQQNDIQYFSSEDINAHGADTLLSGALKNVDPRGNRPIHLSFDVDLFDGADIISTGTKVPEGPRVDEVFSMGTCLAETGRLRSMDVVELNPLLGSPEEVRESTELVMSFLSTTIKKVFNEEEISLPGFQEHLAQHALA